MTLLTGILYPLVVTAIASIAFPRQAEGSLIELEGDVVGSSLLAQPFDGEEWFHPRPSAVSHDPTVSGASNLGPTNQTLISTVSGRASAYRTTNGMATGAQVPIDAVTTSASGLDPHISPANATLQARRVASVRGLDIEVVLGLIERNTSGGGALSETAVNVVTLNADLERLR
jgi:potassium-transporting ATPase KdpC subunit